MAISKEEAESKIVPMCFILARKNSKRLPHKAMALLDGKPLIYYPIKAAQESGCFEVVIVSSDDMNVLEYAYDMKALPHQRPAGLATSNSKMRDVVQFLLGTYQTEIFCMLSPCNPFVTGKEIREAYDLLWKKDANYVVSIKRMNPPPQHAMRMKGDWITSVLDKKVFVPSQKLERMYALDGGLIWAKTGAFVSEFDYDFRGTKCLPYFLKRSVDIDYEDDLRYAEYLIRSDNVQKD